MIRLLSCDLYVVAIKFYKGFSKINRTPSTLSILTLFANTAQENLSPLNLLKSKKQLIALIKGGI